MLPTWLTDTVTSDLDRAIHYTLLWGLEGVELRTVGTPDDRVPFVNEEKLKRRLAENDLPVVSIVPGMFEGSSRDRLTWLNELASFEETLSFCERIGCPCVVVSAFADDEGGSAVVEDAIRKAGTAAARHGIRIAVLNEVGGAYSTGTALAGLLAVVDHASVVAAWSPAAAFRSGEDPRVGLEALGKQVALVRCSDGDIHDGVWQPAPLGEGSVGWGTQFHALRAIGFEGPLSLEIELEPAPKHGLHEATRLVQLIRQTR